MGMRRGTSLLLTGCLLVSACGAGDGATGESTAPEVGSDPLAANPVEAADLSRVDGVGPLVDLLEAAVELSIETVEVGVDSVGGSLVLVDGATLVVDSGAFTEPTVLTVTVVDVPLDEFATAPPEVTLYVLSTSEDVEPVTPVVLDIPVPSSEIDVSTFADGDWEAVEVADGGTTQIEFDHFSDQARATVRPDPDTALRSEVVVDQRRIEAYEAAAEQFRVCIAVLGGTHADVDYYGTIRGGRVRGDDLTAELAFSFCTSALVRQLTPGNRSVSVGCVGDQVDRGDSVLEAIDACIALRDDDRAEADETTSGGGDQITEPDDPQGEAVDAPRVFNGDGAVVSVVETVRTGETKRCDAMSDMTLTLHPDGSLELFVAVLAHVAGDVCDELPGQIHVGRWVEAEDGSVTFEVDSVGETATDEKVTGTVTVDVATGTGGFTAHTVLSGEVRTRFFLGYEFALAPAS